MYVQNSAVQNYTAQISTFQIDTFQVYNVQILEFLIVCRLIGPGVGESWRGPTFHSYDQGSVVDVTFSSEAVYEVRDWTARTDVENASDHHYLTYSVVRSPYRSPSKRGAWLTHPAILCATSAGIQLNLMRTWLVCSSQNGLTRNSQIRDKRVQFSLLPHIPKTPGLLMERRDRSSVPWIHEVTSKDDQMLRPKVISEQHTLSWSGLFRLPKASAGMRCYRPSTRIPGGSLTSRHEKAPGPLCDVKDGTSAPKGSRDDAIPWPARAW